MPSRAPYRALISNRPSSFPASFNPSHRLSFAAFSLFHSDVLTLASLGLSGSRASTLDLILTASLHTHASRASITASRIAPSTSQRPVKRILLSSLILFLSSLILFLSSLILFLSSLIFSFHPFIPFILSFLSLPRHSHAAFQASPSGRPSRRWLPSRPPRVIFKHRPTTIPRVTGIAPAAFNATRPLFEWIRADLVARPHRPCTVVPRL